MGSLFVRLWLWLFYRKGWLIGPFVDGARYSKGFPWRPVATAGGWTITLGPGSEVDYVTRDTGPLSGSIKFRYRFSGAVKPTETNEPPTVSLHFQRQGDDWSGAGEFEFYRWYSLEMWPLSEGEHGGEVTLAPDKWEGVFGKSDAEGFAAALGNAARVGIVFGSAALRGHGVGGNATFELLEFTHA